MSAAALLTVALGEEADIMAARQRARQIAALLGFEAQDQTRIATAVSEIARNAVSYGGGGRVEFAAMAGARPGLRIVVRDSGPGIADIEGVLEGRVHSAGGMGVGIVGTRRLMDDFTLASAPGAGTSATLCKLLPRGTPPVTPAILARIGRALAASGSADPLAEMRTQNQELLHSLAELKTRQDEAQRLNFELEVTNRGVVALYAELDEKAGQLAALNAALESRVAEAVAQCLQTSNALRQSQKMEAVGQLTGGIAHDFNNLLQIVVGNLELIGRRLPPQDEKLRRATENAMSGAQRAATLTQRLLAFSRQQPLAPKPVHPNQLVESLLDLLGRTLGETVEIQTKLAQDVWIIEIDANQLENALLNLAVNARDAMQPSGTLTITTANGIIGEADADEDTVPGQYVSVSVTDTGTGMSGETMARAFEPFFTTKEAGKGTGLGLSMVFGFVKQSGGHVRIEASLGARHDRHALFAPASGPSPRGTPPRTERGPVGTCRGDGSRGRGRCGCAHLLVRSAARTGLPGAGGGGRPLCGEHPGRACGDRPAVHRCGPVRAHERARGRRPCDPRPAGPACPVHQRLRAGRHRSPPPAGCRRGAARQAVQLCRAGRQGTRVPARPRTAPAIDRALRPEPGAQAAHGTRSTPAVTLWSPPPRMTPRTGQVSL